MKFRMVVEGERSEALGFWGGNETPECPAPPLVPKPAKRRETPAASLNGQLVVNARGFDESPILPPSACPYAQEYLRSAHWKEVRDKRRQLNVVKYKGLCEECLSNKAEECHHTHYETVGVECDDDLRMLCRRCHSKIHGIQGETKKQRRERLKERRHVMAILEEVEKMGGRPSY